MRFYFAFSRKTWVRLRLEALLALLIAFSAPSAFADGTEALGPPSIAIETGSGIAVAGTGMFEQPATLTIEIPAGATVKQALLYWEGLMATNAPGDETIKVNGTEVTGTLIGGQISFGTDRFTSAFRADITALEFVSAGTNVLTLDDLSFSRFNNGAGLLVIYDDGSPAAIDIRDGLDVAFINLAEPQKSTVPQNFAITPATFDRTATLSMFFSSVEGADSGEPRPSSIEINVLDASMASISQILLSDQLHSADGDEWDTLVVNVNVPAGAVAISVQAFSRSDTGSTATPASLAWLAAGLRVEQQQFCWVTYGGFHNGGITAGSKDFTFGGNIGPPPSGSMEVIDHNTGDNFHSNDLHVVDCIDTGTTGPQQPGGKKGFTIDKLVFRGTGRFNGVDGYTFEGFFVDGGEPADKNGNDPDYFEVVVKDPSGSVVLQTSLALDGGNVQIHPPNPSLLKSSTSTSSSAFTTSNGKKK